MNLCLTFTSSTWAGRRIKESRASDVVVFIDVLGSYLGSKGRERGRVGMGQ